ncbi:MAG: metallophosphoesterase [Clostridium sp.]|nr:metallophosphoesterase [Clostridium sp.]
MRLVLLGDFHYSALEEKDKSKDIEIFNTRDNYYEKVISEFLNTEGDYHISLGDITNFGDKEELKYVFNSMKKDNVNFIYVIGNHDSYNSSKKEILREVNQKRYFSILEEGIKLIFIDSTLESNRECWAGSIDEDQLKWLENEIISSKEETILIFSHHPAYNTTALSTKENLYIKEIDELNRILELHKGRGVFFCGHNHLNSISKRENWLFVQTGAILDINAFRVVDINEDNIDIHYKEIEDVNNILKFIGENMNYFMIKEDARGREEDRVLLVSNL